MTISRTQSSVQLSQTLYIALVSVGGAWSKVGAVQIPVQPREASRLLLCSTYFFLAQRDRDIYIFSLNKTPVLQHPANTLQLALQLMSACFCELPYRLYGAAQPTEWGVLWKLAKLAVWYLWLPKSYIGDMNLACISLFLYISHKIHLYLLGFFHGRCSV